MFEGVFGLLRNVKILVEASVLIGVALLIYYWSVTISFFPPALSLGDVAKLLVVATVGAFTFSLLTLYTICFGAVPVILTLYAIPRFKVSFGCRRHCLRAISAVRSSDLVPIALAGSFFLPFYLISNVVAVTPRNALGVLVASFSFLFLVYFVMSRSSPSWRQSDGDLDEKTRDSKIAAGLGLFLGVVSALVIWGGPNAFLYATMKQAGVLTLNQSVFVEDQYCPLLGSAFITKVSQGYCYVQGADILFQGMGERLLLANLENDFRVSLPANSVFAVDGFNDVDSLWTPETTKPAQGGLSR